MSAPLVVKKVAAVPSGPTKIGAPGVHDQADSVIEPRQRTVHALLLGQRDRELEEDDAPTTVLGSGTDGARTPDETLDELRAYDAILLGAVGTPEVPPGVIERGLLLKMRFALDQYVNLRPFNLAERNIEWLRLDGFPSGSTGPQSMGMDANGRVYVA